MALNGLSCLLIDFSDDNFPLTVRFRTVGPQTPLPEVWVGRSCRLRRCIIDRACVIPEGMVIGENAEEDARRFYRSEEGIVLVTREMLRKLQIKQER